MVASGHSRIREANNVVLDVVSRLRAALDTSSGTSPCLGSGLELEFGLLQVVLDKLKRCAVPQLFFLLSLVVFVRVGRRDAWFSREGCHENSCP